MEIQCPGCNQALSYAGEAPRFCQNCGANLSGHSTVNPMIETGIQEDVTVPPNKTTVPPPKPSGEGDFVGPYQLVRWLGSGGMGNVWEAVETATGRRVALKRLSKIMVTDENYVQRFVREGQLAAKISHPKVTFIYGTGSDAGQPYIAMELMPGETLNDRVQQSGPLDVPMAVDRILDVVDGLMAAHRLGMIHRDVKPANCFMAADGSVKVGDFGLSKSLNQNDSNLTQTGTFMGTPSYAAPEQIRGADLDVRTDVYAVGATLFYLLTGRTPFKGDAMSVTAQIISDRAPSCRDLNQNIPQDLDAAIVKCLEKEPPKRFQELSRLRSALLPFASKPETITEAGRRLAAYMIDQSMLQIVFMAITICCSMALAISMQIKLKLPQEEFQAEFQKIMPTFTTWAGFFQVVIFQLYYSVFEGFCGRGLGKRLLGLYVVNREGQRPGFWRAFARALAIPTGFFLPAAYVIGMAWYGAAPTGISNYLTFFILSLLTSLLPALICMSTMRTNNGLLGIHEMYSGTRVIRLNTGKRKIPVPVVLPKLNTLTEKIFGPYSSHQLLGQSESGGKVYLGNDTKLNRDVWIVEHDSSVRPDQQRINLARPSRQRWLEGGVSDGNKWNAFEAIHGLPIHSFVGIQKQADWSHYGQVMLDIVEELRESLSDGTLPASLSLPQVWLDQDGHAKLLDQQLVNVIDSKQSWHDHPIRTESSYSRVEQSVLLVQELGDLFMRTAVLPSSVQDFLCELEIQPTTEATLIWANDQLKTLSKNKERLTWDSRLGVWGATFGIEMPVYFLFSALVFTVCYYVVPIPNSYRFLVGLLVSSLLPMVFSGWLRGGPVFHFMGIQVCNSRGRPASQLQNAIRGTLSWMPATAMCGVFLLMLMNSEAQVEHLNPEPGTLMHDLVHNPTIMLGVLVLMLLSLCLMFFGLVVALISPRRGLVDFLLRTQLMPK